MLRLKFARQQRMMAQETLSLLTGIDQASLSRLENGKIYPYAGWAQKISEVMGIPANQLFEEVTEDGEALA